METNLVRYKSIHEDELLLDSGSDLSFAWVVMYRWIGYEEIWTSSAFQTQKVVVLELALHRKGIAWHGVE